MDAQAFREIQVFAPVWRPHRGEAPVCVRSESSPERTYTVLLHPSAAEQGTRRAHGCTCEAKQWRRSGQCKHERAADLGRAWWAGALFLHGAGGVARVRVTWERALVGVVKGSKRRDWQTAAMVRFLALVEVEGR